jgi:hypothetical protein
MCKYGSKLFTLKKGIRVAAAAAAAAAAAIVNIGV